MCLVFPPVLGIHGQDFTVEVWSVEFGDIGASLPFPDDVVLVFGALPQ